MDRRDTLKTLLVGSVAGGAIGTVAIQGCQEASTSPEDGGNSLYGRTPDEIDRDKALHAKQFYTESEMETVAILCDIILPATQNAGSATEAGVPEFVEFISKDLPYHQLPIRGGLMWLDQESNRRFNNPFNKLDEAQQISIVDDIAFPKDAKPEFSHGVEFFNRMRNLTLTGYYTTKMGIDDLGYVGNVPNIWDGVPENVLAKHDVDYDPEWIAKCVDQSKRNDIAEWDENGNLLT